MIGVYYPFTWKIYKDFLKIKVSQYEDQVFSTNAVTIND